MPRLVYVRPLSGIERAETERRLALLGPVYFRFFATLAFFLFSAGILVYLYSQATATMFDNFFGMIFLLTSAVSLVFSWRSFTGLLRHRRLMLDLRRGVFRLEGPITVTGPSTFRIGLRRFIGSMFTSRDFTTGDSVLAEFTAGTHHLLSLSKLT